MNSVRSRRNWQICFCPTIDSCPQDLVRGCCRPSTLKRSGASLSTWTSTGFANIVSAFRIQRKKFNGGTILFFKIGEKMYAVVALEPGDHWLAFKCSPKEFSALVERPKIVPAPYLARAQWVALETYDALPADEIKRLLSQAYSMIFRKLSKRLQAGLTTVNRSKTTRHRRKTARNLQRHGNSSRSAASRKRK